MLKEKPRQVALVGIGPDERILDDGRQIPASPHIGFVGVGTPFHQRSEFGVVDEPTRITNGDGDPEQFFPNCMTQGPFNIVSPNEVQGIIMIADTPTKVNNMERVIFQYPNTQIPAGAVTFNEGTRIYLHIDAARRVLDKIKEHSGRQIFPVPVIE